MKTNNAGVKTSALKLHNNNNNKWIIKEKI